MLMEDIAKGDWAKVLIATFKDVVTFICNHHAVRRPCSSSSSSSTDIAHTCWKLQTLAM